jgi:hypothetical protein
MGDSRPLGQGVTEQGKRHPGVTPTPLRCSRKLGQAKRADSMPAAAHDSDFWNSMARKGLLEDAKKNDMLG